MRIVMVILKIVFVAIVTIAVALLAQRFGAVSGLAIFAGVMGVVCVGTALAVRSQPPEKVTIANYVMGFVLPWGYRIGRGKLPWIVVTSWCIWMLIGVASVIAMRSRDGGVAASASGDVTGPRSAIVMTLLVIAWVIDGAALLKIIGLIATSTNASHLLRSLGPIALLLLAMIGVSAGIVLTNSSAAAAWMALLIAGGPVALVGVGYGLFMIVILTVGRSTRWN